MLLHQRPFKQVYLTEFAGSQTAALLTTALLHFLSHLLQFYLLHFTSLLVILLEPSLVPSRLIKS